MFHPGAYTYVYRKCSDRSITSLSGQATYCLPFTDNAANLPFGIVGGVYVRSKVACVTQTKFARKTALGLSARVHLALSEPVASSKTRRTYSSAVLSRRSCYVSPDLQFKSGSDHALKGRGHSVVARTTICSWKDSCMGGILFAGIKVPRNYARFCLGMDIASFFLSR